MFYKVIRNRQVIDILDRLTYVKYQTKHNLLLQCDIDDAQGILSSTGETAYHINTLEPFPVDQFMTVSLEEISEHEYERLKMLHLKTADEIAEDVLTELLERGMLI